MRRHSTATTRHLVSCSKDKGKSKRLPKERTHNRMKIGDLVLLSPFYYWLMSLNSDEWVQNIADPDQIHATESDLGLQCFAHPVCHNTWRNYGKSNWKIQSDNACTYIYIYSDTLQPLYNTVHYNRVLDITRFKDGSQKCIDYKP